MHSALTAALNSVCRPFLSLSLQIFSSFYVFKREREREIEMSPLTGPVSPRGFQEVQAPRFPRHSAREGGEVVSLTHRSPLPPRKCSWYSFSIGSEWTVGRNMSLKSSDTTGTVRLVAQRLNHYATPGPSSFYALDNNKGQDSQPGTLSFTYL
jgi:hypothetical protein